MDPQYANIAGNVQASRHMFESLADHACRGPPGAAPGRIVVARGAVGVGVQLRRNVKFHDGSAFTPEDVLYSVGRPATLTASPATLNGFLKDISKAEAVNEHTVRSTTSTPLAVLPNYMAMVPMVSKKATTGLKP